MNCRRCNARIRWVRMAKSGKAMPINPVPDADRGNVYVEPSDQACVLTGEERQRAVNDGVPLYLSHYASCPRASQNRKPKEKAS